jgi:catechol 2,3-dioxygenase-like lactoylglutathione lyase family enzyme
VLDQAVDGLRGELVAATQGAQAILHDPALEALTLDDVDSVVAAIAAPDTAGATCQPARSPSWQDSDMERVLGIGGYFMRAADPVALGAWYRDCLGMDADENGLWRQEAGLTVFATFESETDYFGSRAQQAMINFRVRDLDAMLAQLRAKGADVAAETQHMEGVGRFGWVTDPEGNRIELWQPA